MRVVCVNDNFKNEFQCSKLNVGDILTVVEEKYFQSALFGNHTKKCEAGLYYQFVETGGKEWFIAYNFIRVNEDQADETEFIREYNREKV